MGTQMFKPDSRYFEKETAVAYLSINGSLQLICSVWANIGPTAKRPQNGTWVSFCAYRARTWRDIRKKL